MNCQHCQRRIIEREGEWLDPNASGDDRIWRYVCDGNIEEIYPYHQPEEKVNKG